MNEDTKDKAEEWISFFYDFLKERYEQGPERREAISLLNRLKERVLTLKEK